MSDLDAQSNVGEQGGWYCPKCGQVIRGGVDKLPTGTVTCLNCGSLGLRGFDNAAPVRVRCPEGCAWEGWDDGGVNDDLGSHMRREHYLAATYEPGKEDAYFEQGDYSHQEGYVHGSGE